MAQTSKVGFLGIARLSDKAHSSDGQGSTMAVRTSYRIKNKQVVQALCVPQTSPIVAKEVAEYLNVRGFDNTLASMLQACEARDIVRTKLSLYEPVEGSCAFSATIIDYLSPRLDCVSFHNCKRVAKDGQTSEHEQAGKRTDKQTSKQTRSMSCSI
eukprot:6456202-Amphidinium_carterae.2